MSARAADDETAFDQQRNHHHGLGHVVAKPGQIGVGLEILDGLSRLIDEILRLGGVLRPGKAGYDKKQCAEQDAGTPQDRRGLRSAMLNCGCASRRDCPPSL